MPRCNVLSQAEKATCEALKELRKQLRIPRSEFAVLLGMVGARLTNREICISSWKPAEVAHVKRVVAEHLANGKKALNALAT